MLNTIRDWWKNRKRSVLLEHYDHLPLEFEKDPLKPRTSAQSQLQDSDYGLRNRNPQRDEFEKRTFESAKEALSDQNGHSTHSAVNPNRERHY